MKTNNKSKNSILIFEYSVAGHRLEYIHHLYIKALDYPEKNFIIALPNDFANVKDKLKWPVSTNIHFYFFDKSLSVSESAFMKTILLKNVIKKFNVDSVFLISLMQFLPALPFLISKNIKVSGIIYMIYLYRWKESPVYQKIQDALKYLLFSKMQLFENIFILNDATSARYLNIKFKTDKFLFLPDPFVPIISESLSNIRKELNVSQTKKVFLHFGGLTRAKGTIEILKAIKLLEKDKLRDLCFIFAGKIYDDIRDEFYMKMNIQKKRVKIICFDEFCDYSFLGSLCISSDYLLMPYKRTSQSSGLIGFAAQFNIPVVVPNEKLLGKLVKKYDLGYTIKSTDAENIALFLINIPTTNCQNNSSYYLAVNNVANFTTTVFKQFGVKQAIGK